MQSTSIEVPAMYADHHVTAVRKTLTEIPGVAAVLASAACRSVRVSYDEHLVSEEQLHAALAGVGYVPGQEIRIGEFPMRHQDGSAWYTVADRTATTVIKDREMAGDFRRY